MTTYDAYPYRAFPIPEAHVDRLQVVAHLFGMAPAPVERCRVLELGCADGGHLVPMAEALPESTFVGVDLAQRQIDDGRTWVAPLGLDNLELIHGDALELPDRIGTFDYVICHGMYSWIPPVHRPGLLRSIRQHLRPNGVAYLSFNTLPGWYTRREIREFIQHHGAETDDPEERVQTARAMLGFLHDAADEATTHGQHLKATCAELLTTSPQYLIHGLLAEHNDPCYLRDLVDAAGAADLDYLGDAHLGRMTGATLGEAARAQLGSVPGDQVDREQVIDVLAHRAFRQALLVPRGTPIDRTVPWGRVATAWVSARVRKLGEAEGGGLRFDTAAGPRVATDPVWAAGLEALGEAWPTQLPFVGWAATVAERVGRPVDEVGPELGRQVLPAFAQGALGLALRDHRVAAVLPARPFAPAWARRQLALGHPVTDLAHGYRRLPGPLASLLPLLDGTRTHAELLHALSTGDGPRDVGPLEDWLPGALEALRIRALLRAGEEAP